MSIEYLFFTKFYEEPIYRTDVDAIVIAEVFKKKTAQTPDTVKTTAKRRLKEYDNA